MQERISRFEHIDKTKFCGSRHDYQLTLLGTSVVESGGSVRKLTRNGMLLFRGESPGYAFVFCASMSPSLQGRREAFRPGNDDGDIDFIALSYMETTCPSPHWTMTLWRLPHHDRNTLAVRLDSRRLCRWHRARSGVSISQYSCLPPVTPVFLKTIAWPHLCAVIGGPHVVVQILVQLTAA